MAALLSGCLDAGPLDGIEQAGRGGELNIEMVFVGAGAAKRAEIDSIRIALYDITGDPWTTAPDTFALAGEDTSPVRMDNATGVHYLSRIQVDLSERRTLRVVAFLSVVGEAEGYTGERTITLAPNGRSFVTLVMTGEGELSPGLFDLIVPKTVAAVGADSVEIPVVLVNSDSLGGIQFRLGFDSSVVDTVLGISVDPASRLLFDRRPDALDGILGHFASTDSTARVVVVDLPGDIGDGPLSPLRPIVPGRDLLLSVVVRIRDDLVVLPDTIALDLDRVFFSTPSGDADIEIADPTGGILIVTE